MFPRLLTLITAIFFSIFIFKGLFLRRVQFPDASWTIHLIISAQKVYGTHVSCLKLSWQSCISNSFAFIFFFPRLRAVDGCRLIYFPVAVKVTPCPAVLMSQRLSTVVHILRVIILLRRGIFHSGRPIKVSSHCRSHSLIPFQCSRPSPQSYLLNSFCLSCFERFLLWAKRELMRTSVLILITAGKSPCYIRSSCARKSSRSRTYNTIFAFLLQSNSFWRPVTLMPADP